MKGADTASHSQGHAALVISDENARAVARTRRFVVDELVAHGLGELVADAEVVASELVTNALLHVGPPVYVGLQVEPPHARLEVGDESPIMPLALRSSEGAMTGRGIRLTEALTSAWGATPVNGGKRIWAEFDVGEPPPDDAGPEAEEDELIAMWVGREPEDGSSPEDDLYTVRLGDVPTDLLLTAKSHVDDLVREFTLAASGACSGMSAEVPPALAELIETVVHRFADAREGIRRQALSAASDDQGHVTLELRLPARAAEAAEEYLRALDEADAYCRAARLLTLETPPQHRIFRQWYIGELVDQLREAVDGAQSAPSETFEQRMRREAGG